MPSAVGACALQCGAWVGRNKSIQCGQLCGGQVDVGRKWVAGQQRSQTTRQVVLADKVALACIQCPELLHIHSRKQIEAIFVQVTVADGGIKCLLVCSALLGPQGIHPEFTALVVFAGNEVNHTAHGVGTVNGRGSVFEHFHALDSAGGNIVEVNT